MHIEIGGHYQLNLPNYKYGSQGSKKFERNGDALPKAVMSNRALLVEWLRQQTKLPHLSEANPQVYVETPLHPEKLTVWCALWAGGILLQKR
ncbi:hypothetical protein TNCV_3133111 [Trichonephila clavipes]|nr:hypothetical protein TNCV_3133111 [Trichonephila clavipes]